MKRIMIGALVPDEKVNEVNKKIVELIEKVKGKITDQHVSNAPPQGAGATLGSVS